jgi:hypothetical protein
MILVNGSQTPLSRIRSSPDLAGLAPEPVSDSKGLEKPIACGFDLRPVLKNSPRE